MYTHYTSICSHSKSTIKKPLKENIINKNSPTKERMMKWDWKRAIHQKLVGEIQ
jgi:hypothetical protein